MDIERPLEEWLWTLWREWQRLIEEELRRFAEPVQIIINNLLSEPLPPDWRKTLHAYLDSWSYDGYRVAPKDRVALFQWIRAWAGARNLLPPGDAPDELELRGGSNLIGPGSRKIGGEGNVEVHWAPQPEADSGQPQQIPVLDLPAISPDWPRLTDIERKREQNRTGLPGWYPFQPVNRWDPISEWRFETIARFCRERLFGVYLALEALGQATERMAQAKDGDLDELIELRSAVQRKFDDYLAARIVLEREWLRYLKHKYLVVGIFVLALIEKIDRKLPTGIEPLGSPLVAELKAARMASFREMEAMRKNIEGTYTALLWTDRVITAIQLLNVVRLAVVGAQQVFKKAVESGVKRAIAIKAAVTYAAVQTTVAFGTGAAASVAVPRILAGFGLNDAQVQIGLSIYATIGALGALKTGPIVRRRVRLPRPRSKPASPPPKKPPRNKIAGGNRFNESRKLAYPYNEVWIEKANGPGYWKLDSYSPFRKEIVSRKDTQLSEITEKTALGYLNEIVRKYSPGSIIANVPTNRGIAGEKLQGRMILEVPVQWKQIPKQILAAAESRRIVIRDVNLKEYK